MIEALTSKAFGGSLPSDLRSLEQGECPHHIGTSEDKRIRDTAIYMALCCEMNDPIDSIALKEIKHLLIVTDIPLHEGVVRSRRHILEGLKVPRISQLIQADDVILGILMGKETDDM